MLHRFFILLIHIYIRTKCDLKIVIVDFGRRFWSRTQCFPMLYSHNCSLYRYPQHTISIYNEFSLKDYPNIF